MANMIAKKNIFEGIFKIDDIDKHNMLLKDFPVSNIWGIGEKYTNKLNSFGINFAYQLMECNDSWLKTNFPLTMLRTVLELRGEPGFDLKANDRMKRSITVSRTFPTRIDSFEDLVKNISNYAAICGYKLRKQKSFATIMKVFVYGKNFENKMNKEVRKIYFNIATNDSFEIISKSIAALRDIYKADYTYKKGGVVLYNISPCNKLQLNCFDHDDILIRENIMNVVDGLNDKFGRSKVYFGINGRGARYRACQSFSSPHYTTNINELFKVHC